MPGVTIEAADRALDALESAMIGVSKNSGLGHWREELAKPVQIVRVLHAAREVQDLLGLSRDEQ